MSLEGTHVRSIQVKELLGAGGMGEVYLGWDEVLKRKVALKTIRAARHMDGATRQRFVREAQILSQLEHPNICRIYDLVSDDGQDILVLELVDGVNLRQRWESGLTEQAKLDIAAQITSALEAAHTMSVVHRDLKPENIMVTPDGEVKILDFGLARTGAEDDPDRTGPEETAFADSGNLVVDSTNLSGPGRLIGTPRYMSPEQASGGPVTAASDMYSLGLVFQELFTGKNAFGEGVTINTTLRKAQWGDVKPLEGVHPQIAKVIQQLQADEPRDRPSATALGERLRWIIGAPRRKRIRWLVAGVWIVLLALSAGLGVQSYRATRAAEQARLEAETSNRVSAFMVDIFRAPSPWDAGDGSVSAREILERGAAKIEHELVEEPLVKARLQASIGNTYAALGLYEEAEEILEKTLAVRERLLGADHPDIATNLDDLAWVIGSRGDFERSEDLFLRALEIREDRFGADHLDVAQSLISLADTRVNYHGDYRGAKPLCERAVDIRVGILGVDHVDVAHGNILLGVIHRELGNYDLAEALLVRAIEVNETALGPHHSHVAEALNALAIVYSKLGNYPRAIELHSRALEIREAVYGPNHWAVSSSLGNLAVCYSRQGRLDKSGPLLERVLEIRTHALGFDHPTVAEAFCYLGGHRLRVGKLDEAEDFFRRGLTIREEAFGPDSPAVASALSGLVAVLIRDERYDEAEPLGRRALQIDEDAFGPEHRKVGKHLSQLGAIQYGLGNLEVAESNLRRALAVKRKTIGPGHYDVAVDLEVLAELLLEEGRTDEAQIACAEGIQILQDLVSGDPSNILAKDTLSRILARCHRSM